MDPTSCVAQFLFCVSTQLLIWTELATEFTHLTHNVME